MEQYYLRFKIIKENKAIEVKFDSRLSFKENFNLLKYHDLAKLYVYDDERKLFLNRDIPLKEYEIKGFKTFQLY